MKKKLILKVIILITLFCLAYSLTFLESRESRRSNYQLKKFSALCQTDLGGGTIVDYFDHHGGMLGDGDTIMEIHYTDDSLLQKISESDVWLTLPFPEVLREYIYNYPSIIPGIPEIPNGFYCYYDKNHESKPLYDGSYVLNGVPRNFILFIYDSDNNILYIHEYDS